MDNEVIDNAGRTRFELAEQGLIAFATYRMDGDTVLIPHVEAPPELRGKGTAARLMTGVLDLIRERGQKVVPLCPYAAHFIERRPQYQDLVA